MAVLALVRGCPGNLRASIGFRTILWSGQPGAITTIVWSSGTSLLSAARNAASILISNRHRQPAS
jgi:hypothetical protein